jgi:alpha-L-arabinofuranosidase
VHPALDKPINTQIALNGVKIAHASAAVLTATDMHAHNSFDMPSAVKASPLSVEISDGMITANLPPASVVTFQLSIR